jgi:imidazolonepropionase-like amidohydrolase
MSDQETGLFGMFVGIKADTTKIGALIDALKKNNIAVVPTQSLAEKWFSPTFDTTAFTASKEAAYMSAEVKRQWLSSKRMLLQNPAYRSADVDYFVSLRRKLIKACNDKGVLLLLGCDAPQVFNVPGFSTHDELFFLVQSGLTPYQALKTGTVNVATYLNLPGSGVIKRGAPADLVLLSGNPLVDITQTRNIEGVFLHGKWLSKTIIEAELKKLQK